MKFLPEQKNYPKKVFVTNEYYRIQFCKRMKDFGLTDPVKLVIKIKAGMSKRETFCTFIHELIHAIEFSHNIKIKHKTVYKLERALFELLVDNFL